MTLNHEVNALVGLVRDAEDARDQRLAIQRNQKQRYHSPFYKSRSGEQSEDRVYDPENHAFEFVTRHVPELIFNNPTVRVGSRKAGIPSWIAVAMKHVINRIVEDTNFARTMTYPAYDCLFNWGATLTTQADHPSILDDKGSRFAKWPQTRRLSPRRYFIDNVAPTYVERRFEGHSWEIDKNDLEKRAGRAKEGWDKKAIGSLPVDAGIDELRGQGVDTHYREEVIVTEMWDREYNLPEYSRRDGFNGTIFTLAKSSGKGSTDGVEIRKPRPWYGPSDGPYDMCGLWYIQDEVYGLAPLTATEGQQRDLNMHANAVSSAAGRYKRFVLVDDTDPDLIDRIKSEEFDAVLPVSGLTKGAVVPIEVGGITEQNIAYLGIARERLERVASMDDSRRGVVTGKGTATEAALANASADIRTDMMKRQFSNFVTSILKKWAWFIWHDDRFKYPLDSEAMAEIGGMPDGLTAYFRGGGKTGVLFEDLELSIQPQSMEHTAQGLRQRQTLELVQVLSQVVQIAQQAPFLDVEAVVDMIGDAYNFPGLGKLLKFDDMAQMLGLSQFAPQGATQGQFQSRGPSPMGMRPSRGPAGSPGLGATLPATQGLGEAGGQPAAPKAPVTAGGLRG